MNFKDHFSGHATDYARFRPGYPVGLFDAIAGLCLEHRLAWDCACGNGQATAGLAERFDRVVATDASPQQIESAVPIRGVEFRVAPAEHSGLPERSVDLVVVAQALHWFDTSRFYAEANRVLKPAGVLCVFAYEVCRVAAEVDAIIDRLYRDLAGPYWPPERRHFDSGYETLSFPEPRLALPPFDMRAQWTADEMLGYLGTWSAVRRMHSETGRDPVSELEPDFRAAWREKRREVRWPLVVLARRNS